MLFLSLLTISMTKAVAQTLSKKLYMRYMFSFFMIWNQCSTSKLITVWIANTFLFFYFFANLSKKNCLVFTHQMVELGKVCLWDDLGGLGIVVQIQIDSQTGGYKWQIRYLISSLNLSLPGTSLPSDIWCSPVLHSGIKIITLQNLLVKIS